MAKRGLVELASGKIKDIRSFLLETQERDGSWHFCFDTGASMDAYMIILLRHLNIMDEIFINELARRILSMQEPSGAWKLFYDEPEGNLSVTIECYYALLLAGHRKKEDPVMQKAREFILSRGGPHKAGSLTKVVLALTGHYSWDDLPGVPVELILLPEWFPVNFFDLVSYSRVHSAPLMVCSSLNYSLKLPDGPSLSDLFPAGSRRDAAVEMPERLAREIEKGVKKLLLPRGIIKSLAMNKLEQFMLARIEWDGTLYCYFTSTFLMIFALLALGYDRHHPVITKAYYGLKAMVCFTGLFFHQQETTSTVWDTALISYALQESGLAPSHSAIQKAAAYLLEKQHTRNGDWKIHNPEGRPGGWGFSHANTINPDVDDTSAALRALHRMAVNYTGVYGGAYRAGLEWLLTMQNDDGGWPAFEKNTGKKWPELLPMPEAIPVLTDPSAADLTGRTLEFLGNYAGMSLERNEVRKGVEWLLKHQEKDGSWYGRWGIAYIYGTWAAVTGLTAVGIKPHHPAVSRAVDWLLAIQNPDGGWGESCLSDSDRRYIPLGFSTPSQTAWAVDALLTAGLAGTPAVTRGIEALVRLMEKNGVEASYPTGAGLPGGFYINYHSYRFIWPLLALAHYLRSQGVD